MLVVAGVTATLATGASALVMVEAPVTPDAAAETVDAPGAIAETIPSAVTRAIVVSLLFQTTARLVTCLPEASFGCAVSCSLAPMRIRAEGGVMSMVATDGGVWGGGPPEPDTIGCGEHATMVALARAPTAQKMVRMCGLLLCSRVVRRPD